MAEAGRRPNTQAECSESNVEGEPEDTSSNEENGDEELDSDDSVEELISDPDHFFGIEAIDRAFSKVYPQSDPTVISSPDFKYWAGGSHPLDYIKVFKNPGDDQQKIKPHWHFVTFGFSDLYGDGRIHPFTGRGHLSGMGFELTFRVTEEGKLSTEPPLWPLRLLDNLARYVFNTGIELKEYDHIPWHEALDKVREGGNCNASNMTVVSTSKVRHMLIVEDPQILNLDTPHGTVQFLQIVGLLEMEFLYTRSWRACAIIDQLLEHPQVGPALVTDMGRKLSVFDLNPLLLSEIHGKVDEEGSHLGRVTAHFQWRDLSKKGPDGEEIRSLEDIELNQTENDDACRNVEAVFLQFEPGAAELLPLMVRGRLRHGLPFTFSSTGCINNSNVQTLQFVSGNCHATLLVDHRFPIRKRGNFLQIWCSGALLRHMTRNFNCLEAIRQEAHLLPLEFRYSNPPIVLSVVPKLHQILPVPEPNKVEPGSSKGQHVP